jgi:hypothetical protein
VVKIKDDDVPIIGLWEILMCFYLLYISIYTFWHGVLGFR